MIITIIFMYDKLIILELKNVQYALGVFSWVQFDKHSVLVHGLKS